MMNINSELQKIKEYLSSKITLGVEIVPHYDWGNKISIICYKMLDNKMTKVEYEFYIKYYEDKDNFENASYLLHCGWSYNLGGGGYADKYESIHDFINTKMAKELIEEYGKDKKHVETLDFNEEDIEEEDLDDELDYEEESVEDVEEEKETNYKELSLFDMEEENKEDKLEEISLDFFSDDSSSLDIHDVDTHLNIIDDLLSYGVDDYYNNNFKEGTPLLNTIKSTLNKLPRYKEYYSKLKDYLFSVFPVRELKDVNFREEKYVFLNEDGTITLKYKRRQSPIYCFEMYTEMLSKKH